MINLLQSTIFVGTTVIQKILPVNILIIFHQFRIDFTQCFHNINLVFNVKWCQMAKTKREA